MFKQLMAFGVVFVTMAAGAPAALSQEMCSSLCDDPFNYCTSTTCFDGDLTITCEYWATNYGQNPWACQEPPMGIREVRYPTDGINWSTEPNGSIVGDCYANCGAGCSDNWNPCGGPTQYWELTYDEQPVHGAYEMFRCEGSNMYRYVYMGYTAVGRWTYHGWVAPGCWSHDTTCPEWTFLGCLLFFGCGDPKWDETWSYTTSLHTIDYQISREWFDSCEFGG